MLTLKIARQEIKLGHLVMAYNDAGIYSILLAKDMTVAYSELQAMWPNALLQDEFHPLVKLLLQDNSYLDVMPLVITGTTFQKLVWQAIKSIAPGQTLTYGQLASLIGKPKAYRAVANACAKNRLAIVIPCHRVVAKSGYGGYRWGIAQKKWLLDNEARFTAN